MEIICWRSKLPNNMNIIRKLPLNILELVEMGGRLLRLKKRRYAIDTNPQKHPGQTMTLQFFNEGYGFWVEHIHAFVMNS